MNTRLFRALSLVVALVLLLPVGGMATSAQGRPAAGDPAPSNYTAVPAAEQRNPVMFIQNAGQFADDVRFQVLGSDGIYWLAEDTLWLTVLAGSDAGTQTAMSRKGVNIRSSFVDANRHPHIEPFDRLDTRVSYFIGSDPAQWHPDVPVWGGVRYVGLYPNIDLEITGESDQIVQRLVAHSGADPSAVRLQVDGADALTLEHDVLRLDTSAGEFTLPLLQFAGAAGAGRAHPRVTNAQVVSPFASAAPRSQSATPNPHSNASRLLYGSFLGSSGFEGGRAIAVDGAGSAYVAGMTTSADFPTTAGAFDTRMDGFDDAFVVKVNPDGTGLTYAAFLGGSGTSDQAYGIAVDEAGNAYVTGETHSADFPTTPGAFDRSRGGYQDAFVVKVGASGTRLSYATYLGGSSFDEGWAIAVDETGNAYVTGFSQSWASDFPTTPGAFDTSPNGWEDPFVVKVNPAGTGLSYATLLGGSDSDRGEGIAVDGTGSAYVTGYTRSPEFPTTAEAFDTSYNGDDSDAFVVKVNPSGTGLTYSTFLGGSVSDSALAIAVDGEGCAYVTGYTWSSDFPTTQGAFDRIRDEGDAFVVKLNAAGAGLSYATLLGGSYYEEGQAIAVDVAGSACVTGVTSSSDFPTTAGAFDTSYDGAEFFVVRLNIAGTGLGYATFLGGTSVNFVRAIAIDSEGSAYVTGATMSADFPTTAGAFDTSYNGGDRDAFVAKLRLCSPNVDAYVDATPLVGAPPGDIAAIFVKHGNRGATTATSVTLVATLSSGLTYVSDTSGIPPGLGNNTVTWNLPALAFRESGGFVLQVGLDGAADIGTRYSLTLAISSAGTEDNPSDNTTIIEVMAAQPTYLPIILLNH